MWGRARAGTTLTPRRGGVLPLLATLALTIMLGLLVSGAGAHGVWARSTTAAPNLGPHPRPCIQGLDKTCCPGADCLAHPELLTASPLLVETGVGVEQASPHLIHVGQRFTITFGNATPSSALWSFPNVAKKISRCKAGVDVKCTYLARQRDVTYPEFATYDGWSEFSWQGIDKFGVGTGYGYYAILASSITVSGRLADKHGRGIARGGIQNPGGPTPDPGVLIDFDVRRHGQLIPLYAAAPSINGSPVHPYDVGYYGLLIKPGTYEVYAGDFLQHISCRHRTLHLRHSITHFNLTCT